MLAEATGEPHDTADSELDPRFGDTPFGDIPFGDATEPDLSAGLFDATYSRADEAQGLVRAAAAVAADNEVTAGVLPSPLQPLRREWVRTQAGVRHVHELERAAQASAVHGPPQSGLNGLGTDPEEVAARWQRRRRRAGACTTDWYRSSSQLVHELGAFMTDRKFRACTAVSWGSTNDRPTATVQISLQRDQRSTNNDQPTATNTVFAALCSAAMSYHQRMS